MSFIKLGDDVWNTNYIKWVRCNEKICQCEIARYKTRYLDRGSRNGDIILTFNKDKYPIAYATLKNIYDKV